MSNIRNLLRSSGRCSLIQSNKFHTSQSLNTFWVSDEKGGYKGRTEKLPPLNKRISEGFKELKNEFRLFKQEVIDEIHGTNMPLIIRRDEIDVSFKFGDEQSIDKWVTSSDSDHNEGFSKCELSLTKEGKGLFSGNLCKTVPKDGKIARAGYCNMATKTFRKSFKRETRFDWSMYNILNMRVRGDGRAYFVNIGTKGYFDLMWNDMYHYIMFTRGGPYWENVRIPFSKFIFSSRGRIQDRQCPINLQNISSFSITLADKVDGKFNLEIDYIGLENDPNHRERFAYEMYETDNNIAAN
ncbi:hypothetical protein WA026_004969 [Henosepilachna vigintioctopunctata]|uniref:NADH:ubiquinone oxidoreductase intermediate-associated protein 30 domain-containing protein n=1 Tax=Henosepilachna vigintioctopunctata TaxID=420089 RepID=A0AAW1UK93_9CUCU